MNHHGLSRIIGKEIIISDFATYNSNELRRGGEPREGIMHINLSNVSTNAISSEITWQASDLFELHEECHLELMRINMSLEEIRCWEVEETCFFRFEIECRCCGY